MGEFGFIRGVICACKIGENNINVRSAKTLEKIESYLDFLESAHPGDELYVETMKNCRLQFKILVSQLHLTSISIFPTMKKSVQNF